MPQLHPCNYLCNNPLDRSSHKRLNEQWMQTAKQHPDSTYIVFSNLSPLTYKLDKQHSTEFKLARFTHKSVLELASLDKLLIFLGIERPISQNLKTATQDPDSGWFAVTTDLSLDELIKLYPSISILPCENGFKELPRSEAAVAGMARSLFAWHQQTSFCSICGHASVASQGGFKRKCSNEECSSHKSKLMQPHHCVFHFEAPKKF